MKNKNKENKKGKQDKNQCKKDINQCKKDINQCKQNKKQNQQHMIDLMYLTNPNNLERIIKKEQTVDIPVDHYKKYKKNVMEITEKILDGDTKKMNTRVLDIFQDYYNSIVEEIKFNKKQTIIQSQYGNIDIKKVKKDVVKLDIGSLDINLLPKKEKKKKCGMDNFVKKKKKKKVKSNIIIPVKKDFS
tara:strand:+ start:359 stop:922 length:564 start_codon:yes stop_codon:yes gene_type:complete